MGKKIVLTVAAAILFFCLGVWGKPLLSPPKPTPSSPTKSEHLIRPQLVVKVIPKMPDCGCVPLEAEVGEIVEVDISDQATLLLQIYESSLEFRFLMNDGSRDSRGSLDVPEGMAGKTIRIEIVAEGEVKALAFIRVAPKTNNSPDARPI